MVASWRALGRNSGDMVFICRGNAVTFNGEHVVSDDDDASNQLVWNSTTITYHGITVTA